MAGHILLVEDNLTLRRLYSRELRRSGLEVTETGTIQEARAELQKGAFDAVVLDMLLTDGNGLELMADLESYNLPTLAVSAEENTRSLFTMDRGRFIAKPIPTSELVTVVWEMLGTDNTSEAPTP